MHIATLGTSVRDVDVLDWLGVTLRQFDMAMGLHSWTVLDRADRSEREAHRGYVLFPQRCHVVRVIHSGAHLLSPSDFLVSAGIALGVALCHPASEIPAHPSTLSIAIAASWKGWVVIRRQPS